MYRYRSGSSSLAGTLISLIVFAAILVILYYLFRMFYWLAALAMPVLLIATLLINYRVVTRFFLMLWSLIKVRPVLGVLASVFTVLLFPVVVVILFVQALFLRKVARVQQRAEEKRYGEWAEFEVIEEHEPQKNAIQKKENIRLFNDDRYV